ncbi:flagellar assembly protein FliH [Brenneria uluponensis]|uniref:flagellar assembly protein FliH n=1 Tax=Brenneria uluponensis TaxID=3057057 RepID=UPI0028E40B44|nr:flagellar assembly protein FliH [Brenneria ulupoensis]
MSDPDTLPWRPWKLNDLAAPVTEVSVEPSAELPIQEDVTGSTESDNSLELLREQVQLRAQEIGFKEGQQKGYEEGYKSGLEAGSRQGVEDVQKQQEPMIAQMQNMVTEFQQTLDALDSVIASRLMQLALTAAKQVLGQSPVCDGTALLNQIQQLIQQEPMFSGKPQLRVHPSDLERIEQHLGPTLDLHGWRLLADNQLHPGGCKISAEDGDLDASIATRWHELCRLAAPGEL